MRCDRTLGLQDQLVGISHCCDYPASVLDRPVMTRTSIPENAPSEVVDDQVRRYLGDHTALYQLNLDVLESAQPDVIVSQRLCDVCAVSSDDVMAAMDNISSQPVLVDLEPEVLADVFADIQRVGDALNSSRQAQQLITELHNRVNAVADRTRAIAVSDRPRVAMLEWLLPPFSSGHWNPELVELAGGIDCLGPKGKPSQTIQWEDVIAARPDVIVIACCGFDRERAGDDLERLENEPNWLKLMERVEGRVFLSDGNAYFSRPGPRLVDGMEALAHALHPQIHPESQTEARITPVT
jgi:iron complex transport system substrate-binding protein